MSKLIKLNVILIAVIMSTLIVTPAWATGVNQIDLTKLVNNINATLVDNIFLVLLILSIIIAVPQAIKLIRLFIINW